ncbi:hypothetical protein [Streptomyces sp. NPDC059943]
MTPRQGRCRCAVREFAEIRGQHMEFLARVADEPLHPHSRSVRRDPPSQ